VAGHDPLPHDDKGPPDTNSHIYRPEYYYFSNGDKERFKVAVKATEVYAARWADSYVASNMRDPSTRKEGVLLGGPSDRQQVIRDVLDWLEGQTNSIHEQALSLFRGGDFLLDQHDEVPGDLNLSSSEFEQLQDEWNRLGLPRDLYYPIEEQKLVIEPAEAYGTVIRSQRAYTPLQWLHRNETSTKELRVPDEAERVERFVREANEFMQSLGRRMYEINEPGGNPDRRGLAIMSRLMLVIGGLIQRERDGETELLEKYIRRFAELSDGSK
jgi:hypothetical protein